MTLILAPSESSDPHPDRHRHFGLVVDDRSSLRTQLDALGVEIIRGPGLNFRDPWGSSRRTAAKP